MTESRVEHLLRQMSLKEPSAELDERIESGLGRDFPSQPIRRDSRLPWQFVSAMAIACLLIGIVVGRATVSTVAAGEASVADSFAKPEMSSDAVNDVSLSADAAQERRRAALDGPGLAILCSVKARTAPGSEQKRCTKCHSGVANEDWVSDHAHVLKFHRQLCARCHDMDGFLENWRLPDVKDVLTDEPWHGPVGSVRKAPAG